MLLLVSDIGSFKPATKLALICIISAGLHSAGHAAGAAETSWDNPVSTQTLSTTGSREFIVISKGERAGPYQAFPDAARLNNGDIVTAFYSGYGHVSLPIPGWENGGRLCMVRSSDEGRTWADSEIIFDDGRDNRDPHIAQLNDGSIICTFFSLMPIPGKPYSSVNRESSGTEVIMSYDGGKTWENKPRVIAAGWYVSAPVRQLRDGTCLLGIYRTDDVTGEHQGAVIRSTDNGKTWSTPHIIGLGQNLPIDAETDVIELLDGRIFAALRSNDKNLYYAYSPDHGNTWEPAVDIGFRGHAPHLNRLSSGEIIMTHRLPSTSMHISRDETKSWEGPYLIDNVFGAYASTVELKDGSVLVVYYTEGKNSKIRARRFTLKNGDLEYLPVTDW